MAKKEESEKKKDKKEETKEEATKKELLIRSEMHEKAVFFDKDSLPDEQQRAMKKMLAHFYNLEALEGAHYKYQIAKKWPEEYNHLLLVSFANEMTHIQDFGVRSLERTRKADALTGLYALAGAVLGIYLRFRSKEPMLRMNIFMEERAIEEYERTLKEMKLDEKTRAMMEHNLGDEREHRDRLEVLLAKL